MTLKAQKKKDYQKKWMRERRNKYISELGPCYMCGSYENIEIHHLDPSEKESHKIWSWNEKRLRAELKKCVPMCKTCHKKFHDLLKKKPLIHGTIHGYKKYKCRCEACVLAHQIYKTLRRKKGSATYIQVQQVFLDMVG